MWPARRRVTRETTESLLLATALTTLAAVAVASPHVGAWEFRPPSLPLSRAEAVIYVAPPTHATPPAPRMPTRTREVARRGVVPLAEARELETQAPLEEHPSIAGPPPTVSDSARPARAAPVKLDTRPVAGPVIAPLGYSRPVGPRVIRLLPGGSTLGDWRLVPTDEQAGLVSEERRRFEEARLIEPADVAARGGAASITTGWLGPGPTKEERRRDSAIHAGNLRRLAALAARAQARLDSIRRADSLSHLAHPAVTP